MKKLGFVIPWFGFDIPGGAEAELKGIVLHLHQAGVRLEILTTCVREFNSDWSRNAHKQGCTIEHGILVRRFKVRRRDTQAFDQVNVRLMKHQMPLARKEEAVFVNEMINSPDLYRYIRMHKEDYSLFVFIPYMFGTTYFGIQECYDQAVMIPCFHKESYVYLKCFRREFSKIAGMIFHAGPEAGLAARIFDLNGVNTKILGGGVDTDFSYKSDRFRSKYQIREPFILYAGRKDAGKNVYLLLDFFREYKYRNANDMKLVLIGGGSLDVPDDIQKDVTDLGYIDAQDKFDAYAAACMLCQPSVNESFSIVMMESWVCERPVLVHEKCEVTRYFVTQSGGGLYFDTYFEFEGCVNYMLEHEDIAVQMGKSGRKYVLEHFAWDVMVEKYIKYFHSLIEKERP